MEGHISRLPLTRERPVPPSAGPADQTRINERIRIPEVRLIDENGMQVGVVPTWDAMQRANVAGLDLVEVAPLAKPPVCKIMDYNKFKYQKSVREKEARRKQTRIDIKEMKFRPGTDTHDFEVKLRKVKEFLEEGDKVKCTIRFRGREMVHQDLGIDVLDRLVAALGEVAKVEQEAKLFGKQMTMVIAPTMAVKLAAQKRPPSASGGRADDDDDDDEDDDED